MLIPIKFINIIFIKMLLIDYFLMKLAKKCLLIVNNTTMMPTCKKYKKCLNDHLKHEISSEYIMFFL